MKSTITLLSKSDYSRKKKISRPTIDRMIKNGDLKTERIGKVDFIIVAKRKKK